MIRYIILYEISYLLKILSSSGLLSYSTYTNGQNHNFHQISFSYFLKYLLFDLIKSHLTLHLLRRKIFYWKYFYFTMFDCILENTKNHFQVFRFITNWKKFHNLMTHHFQATITGSGKNQSTTTSPTTKTTTRSTQTHHHSDTPLTTYIHKLEKKKKKKKRDQSWPTTHHNVTHKPSHHHDPQTIPATQPPIASQKLATHHNS